MLQGVVELCQAAGAKKVRIADNTIEDANFCFTVSKAAAISKKPLKVGDTLDGIGGYTAYTLIDNFQTCREQDLLPMGVSEGCKVIRDIPADTAITYADVELPKGRLVDELRNLMIAKFS